MPPERSSERPQQTEAPSSQEPLRSADPQMTPEMARRIEERENRIQSADPQMTPEMMRRIEASEQGQKVTWTEDMNNGSRYYEAKIDNTFFVINTADNKVSVLRGGHWIVTDAYPALVAAKLDEVKGVVRWTDDRDPQGKPYSETKIDEIFYVVTQSGAVHATEPDGSWKETATYPAAVAAKRAEKLAQLLPVRRAGNVPTGATPNRVLPAEAPRSAVPTVVPSREAAPTRAPERSANEPLTEVQALDRIRSIRFLIGGRETLPTLAAGINEQYFKRHDIPRERYDEYIAMMQQGAAKLRTTLAARPGWNGPIQFDGQRFMTEDARFNQRLIAYPQFVLEQPLTGDDGKTLGLLDERGARTPDVRVTANKEDANAARFNVFDFTDTKSNRRLYLRHDGTQALERHHAREQDAWKEKDVRWFAVGGGDRLRPTILVVKEPTTVEIPVRDGSSEKEKHLLSRGKYVVPAEGKPIGELDLSSLKSKPEREQRAELKVKARELAGALKTPEAIGSWISSQLEHMPTGGHGTYLEDKAPSSIRGVAEKTNEQNVQHPLWTLRDGRGDCEDIAIFAQYMLKNIGVEAQVIQQWSYHYTCAFLEERTGAYGKRYDLCQIDSYGYTRRTGSKGDATKPFKSPNEALKDIWSGGSSGVAWELQRMDKLIPTLSGDKRADAVKYRDYVKKIEDRGGGIMTLQAAPGVSYDDLPLAENMYKDSAANLDDGAYGFKTKDGADSDWSRIIRKI